MMKPIPRFPGYQITTDGRVWSGPKSNRKNGKWLLPGVDTHDRLFVALYKNSKRHQRLIHRLVLETYIGPCPDGMECRHLDGNHRNNNLYNLCWGTRKTNHKDAIQQGTHQGLHNKGENNGQSKLTEDQVRLIYASYHNGLHTQKELADYFGVSNITIHDIVHKKIWRHLWGTK